MAAVGTHIARLRLKLVSIHSPLRGISDRHCLLSTIPSFVTSFLRGLRCSQWFISGHEPASGSSLEETRKLEDLRKFSLNSVRSLLQTPSLT